MRTNDRRDSPTKKLETAPKEDLAEESSSSGDEAGDSVPEGL